jgi:hypothetical protein
MLATSFLIAVCSYGFPIAHAQSSDVDVAGVQVLTRGPVHEAFAGVVNFNPEPGVIVLKTPPEPIDEIPPELRPAGDNITWIPGYWSWDDEPNEFMWISGTWRALPPGREWIAGYWATSGTGNQWISGYWEDSAAEETVYLPKPPASVEVGPNVESPSAEHGWMPGHWSWNQDRYAWSAGYWAQGRSDWEWTPARYVWTPRGHIFVDGYWDYEVSRRGVLFAPVRFDSNLHSDRGYRYAPSVALDLVSLVEHWFLRPSYQHYYFGDYYDSGYQSRGYYSASAFQLNRQGYDPVYSHRLWENRRDRNWARGNEDLFRYRREHEAARPPRTWADQRAFRGDLAAQREQRLMMGAPLSQVAARKGTKIQYQKVESKEREMLVKRGADVRKFRDNRRTVEGDNAAVKGQAAAPGNNRVKASRSPIVAKRVSGFAKKEAPPKPLQRAKAAPKGRGVTPATKARGVAPEKEKPKQRKSPKVSPDKRPKPGKQQVTPEREQPNKPRAKKSPAAQAPRKPQQEPKVRNPREVLAPKTKVPGKQGGKAPAGRKSAEDEASGKEEPSSGRARSKGPR